MHSLVMMLWNDKLIIFSHPVFTPCANAKQVLERDRQRVAAVGKDYAVRPTSYKGSLSLKQDRYTIRHKSRSRSPDRSAMYRRRKRGISRSPSPVFHRARERDSVKLVTAEGLKKKKMLQSRYGDASAKK